MRPILRLTICSYFIILTGCADLPADGATVDEQPTDGTEALSAALADTDWHWTYYTAALGGDHETWLTFDGEGNARWTRKFWVYDFEDGDSSYPVEIVLGEYTLGPLNRVDVVLGDTDSEPDALTRAGAPAEFYFTGAVSQTLPKLSYIDGQEALTAAGHGLTTRAFASIGNGLWQSVYGHFDTAGHYSASVTATLDFDATECSLVLHLALERTVDGETLQADETTPTIPCRFETVDEGTFAIADTLRYHEDRADLLEEMGTDQHHGDALYYKLTEAMQYLYFRANASPHLLLPNGNNIAEDAWWTPKSAPVGNDL